MRGGERKGEEGRGGPRELTCFLEHMSTSKPEFHLLESFHDALKRPDSL